MDNNKIFITGVAGFLGSRLADEFIEMGFDVYGNDNLTSGYRDNIPKNITKFYEMDCCDLKGMRKVLNGIDVVYHCAAYPYEGLSVFSPSVVTNSIFQATSTIVSALIHNECSKIVYTSSMARFGMNQTPFTEDMDVRPQDPYAVSKVASEELIKLMSRVHDFDYVIAVPHNIYGPNQIYTDPFRNVVGIFINRILQGKQPIIYGDGKQKRCFSYIRDDLPPLTKLATEERIVKETINIGPDKEFVTINELAQTISDIVGFDLNPIYLPDRPQEVRDANCNADKARRLLDYRTTYGLKEGCTEMIDWVEGRGTKPFDYHLDVEIINDKTPKTWTDRLI